MIRHFLVAALFAFAAPANAQDSCINRDNLVELDAGWERALLESDVAFLERVMADEFVWVHNHASSVDTKEILLERAREGNATGRPRAREQSDVTVRITGSVGIVHGFTTVVRETVSPRYTFMRTYAEIDGRCQLLGNQTMQLNE